MLRLFNKQGIKLIFDREMKHDRQFKKNNNLDTKLNCCTLSNIGDASMSTVSIKWQFIVTFQFYYN